MKRRSFLKGVMALIALPILGKSRPTPQTYQGVPIEWVPSLEAAPSAKYVMGVDVAYGDSRSGVLFSDGKHIWEFLPETAEVRELPNDGSYFDLARKHRAELMQRRLDEHEAGHWAMPERSEQPLLPSW